MEQVSRKVRVPLLDKVAELSSQVAELLVRIAYFARFGLVPAG